MGKIADFFRRSGTLSRLIAINVLVFVVVGLASVVGRFAGLDMVWTHDWLSLPSGMDVFFVRPWTLVTYMFTQYEFLHILFNMLWLYWFGQVLLLTLSEKHLLWLYFSGGVLGGLLYLAVYNSVSGFGGIGSELCGSSASVLAVMTAAAFRSPDYRFNLLLIGSVKLKWLALVSIVLAVIGVGGGNAGGELAHLGGVVAGGVFGMMLCRGVDLTRVIGRLFRKRKSDRHGINANKVVSAMEDRRSDMQCLDELLDKIRRSGYESLTRKERVELERLSKRLKG